MTAIRTMCQALWLSGLGLFLVVCASVECAQAEEGYGSISGQIVFEGEPPPRRILVRAGDNVFDRTVCAAEDIPDQSLLIDPQSKGIANVCVYLPTAVHGIHPRLQTSENPQQIVAISQCRFIPHAMILRTDQKVLVKSFDPCMHNIHTNPYRNTATNMLVKSDGELIIPAATLTKPERLPITVQNDMHPWMRAYWLILDHPYAAISNPDGWFIIRDLPAGDHKFVLWQEKSGYINRALPVMVVAGEHKNIGVISVSAAKFEPPAQPVVWSFDRLDEIGGHKTTIVGEPKVKQTAQSKDIEFDGVDDALFLDANPIQGWKEFTVEMIFRPDADGLKEQRFFHIQEEGSENRLLFETRLIADNRWFLDTFIKSGEGNYTLFAEKSPHALGRWHHAALVMDGKTMRHYVDGVEELSMPISFQPFGAGKTSIGVRFNKVHWYKGAIRQVKFTPGVLSPKEFTRP